MMAAGRVEEVVVLYESIYRRSYSRLIIHGRFRQVDAVKEWSLIQVLLYNNNNYKMIIWFQYRKYINNINLHIQYVHIQWNLSIMCMVNTYTVYVRGMYNKLYIICIICVHMGDAFMHV